MSEEPPIPQEPPQIPRGKLWACLLVPPVLSGVFTATIAANLSKNSYRIETLFVLPIGLIAIIACLFPYLAAIRVRYRGRSVALLGWGFFLGQIIICLSVWFGTCLLVLG